MDIEIKERLIAKYSAKGPLWTPKKDDTDFDHENELGVKFWLHQPASQWAWREDAQGRSLANTVIWWVIPPDGHLTMLLVDYDTGYQYSCSNLEEMGSKIDIEKVLKYIKQE